ncbi:MAG TPA: RNA helicase, partial [Alphaproteobacteria bacterium]|nr:RNA helicase [Alphaproteobacteria bacterium]
HTVPGLEPQRPIVMDRPRTGRPGNRQGRPAGNGAGKPWVRREGPAGEARAEQRPSRPWSAPRANGKPEGRPMRARADKR